MKFLEIIHLLYQFLILKQSGIHSSLLQVVVYIFFEVLKLYLSGFGLVIIQHYAIITAKNWPGPRNYSCIDRRAASGRLILQYANTDPSPGIQFETAGYPIPYFDSSPDSFPNIHPLSKPGNQHLDRGHHPNIHLSPGDNHIFSHHSRINCNIIYYD